MYLLVTVGLTVATHFCGGMATSVKMLPFVSNENPCGCDDTAVPDDCCKTEIKSVQLSDEQIAVQIDQQNSPQTDSNLWADVSIEELYSSNLVHTIIPASSPPVSTPTHILHCALLI